MRFLWGKLPSVSAAALLVALMFHNSLPMLVAVQAHQQLAEAVVAAQGSTVRLVNGKWELFDKSTLLDIQATVPLEVPAGTNVMLRAVRLRSAVIDGQVVQVFAPANVKIIEISGAPVGTRLFGIQADKGTYQLEVIKYSQTAGFQSEMQLLEIGTDPDNPDPEPEPDDPTPDPTVPDDVFDNLGQRVAGWAAGLPKRKEVGAIYRAVADQLDAAQIVTINDAAEKMRAERDKILTPDELSKWNVVGDKLKEDLTKRWPLTRGEFAEYYRAIATGLGS